MESASTLGATLLAAALVLAYALWSWCRDWPKHCGQGRARITQLMFRMFAGAAFGQPRGPAPADPRPAPVLECIRKRASVFPRSYVQRAVPRSSLERLLEAAMWAPYHGPKPPWRFVVLGKRAMVEMQQLTLDFYDANWASVPGFKSMREDYAKWRAGTEAEITGRWGPVSYMVGITVQRQAGSKRMPMWEEECATACAVQVSSLLFLPLLLAL